MGCESFLCLQRDPLIHQDGWNLLGFKRPKCQLDLNLNWFGTHRVIKVWLFASNKIDWRMTLTPTMEWHRSSHSTFWQVEIVKLITWLWLYLNCHGQIKLPAVTWCRHPTFSGSATSGYLTHIHSSRIQVCLILGAFSMVLSTDTSKPTLPDKLSNSFKYLCYVMWTHTTRFASWRHFLIILRISELLEIKIERKIVFYTIALKMPN